MEDFIVDTMQNQKVYLYKYTINKFHDPFLRKV